ncbi:glycoside hydrolase family 108 protein [Franzmannia qiaohouensis]|uniref:Glycosyl hydrolase 108 family protein n=1 Tax=Franzmannia qiaohouensis TaxID=1329370 RepID=A0ABU1HAE7_9GAMM|nr:glycosyl hydrolase 108 family protein [Halomonas qiaohouensis]MDR5904415.1 glycosyl hydrolase 108 family protein [Halomonas qiaohouensis]
MDYHTAFARVIGHEGKFQNNPKDRGNWTTGIVGHGENKGTKFGVSAMSYPELDIKNLSLAQAKDVYHRDFWLRVAGDVLHEALVYQLFDAAINHGPGNAIRMLQRAAKVSDDGDMGEITHRAISDRGIDDMLKLFNAERIDFFTRISTFDEFGRGWMRRVAHNLRFAADDYAAPCHALSKRDEGPLPRGDA